MYSSSYNIYKYLSHFCINPVILYQDSLGTSTGKALIKQRYAFCAWRGVVEPSFVTWTAEFAKEWDRRFGQQVRRTQHASLGAISILKTINLPRQARDKHGKS